MGEKLTKIALFTRKNSPHLEFFLKNIAEKNLPIEIKLIVSLENNPQFETLGTRYLGLENFSKQELLDLEVELIVLSDCEAPRVLDSELLEIYRDRILDIFPALLPAFENKVLSREEIIRASLRRRLQITGCTVYKVTENLHQGEILAQSVVEIEIGESFESLEEKLRKEEELLYAYTLVEYLRELPAFDFSEISLAEFKAPNTQKEEWSFQEHTRELSYQSVGFAKAGIALSNIGLKREQDADAIILSSDLRLAGVADGIGSAEHGAQTSQKISEFFHKQWDFANQKNKIQGVNHGIWLKQAVIECNKRLLNWQLNSKEQIDIGSTLVVSLFDPVKKELYISNTGDSRAYLWRKNTLFRLTYDHSENFDVDSGEGDSLLLYMGGETRFFGLDLYLLKIFPEDLIMFCSDGALFASEELISQRFKEFRQSLKELKHLANQIVEDNYQVGAPDNIAVTLVEF